MRVSEHFGLRRTQPTLDFVDVDIRGDTRLFIDPRALRLLPSTWADECVSLVHDFFTAVLGAIREGRHREARSLLMQLREPNETHLGLSRSRARGHALGPESVLRLWESLRESEAVSSGLIEDLEDALLMVRGVGWDIVSDITTNIIREPLIEYTQNMAGVYGIPLEPNVNSGPLWNPRTSSWYSKFVSLPVTPRKLLLVPKVIVRTHMEYDIDEYYRSYLLEAVRDEEVDARTELVYLLKDGTPRVDKKDLRKKYGTGKDVVVEQTLRNPDILRRYRDDKNANPRRGPLDHLDIADREGTAAPDWNALLATLEAIPSGRESFSEYESAIEALLSALFYPSLANPQPQQKLHNGRKRVDIVYTNAAQGGFFSWLAAHYPSAHVFVECKNYAGEPSNPELDQLSGRFSPSRGRFGILTCRNFDDKELFIQRCRDTAQDDRGFIVPLDDSDLATLVSERAAAAGPQAYGLLYERFNQLIM